MEAGVVAELAATVVIKEVSVWKEDAHFPLKNRGYLLDLTSLWGEHLEKASLVAGFEQKYKRAEG